MEVKNFGLTEGINEVICVTEGKSDVGNINTAPIGIIVGENIYIRLFGKTHTLENLKNGSKLYANVCFDPLIFVISAFKDLSKEYFLDKFTLKCAYSVLIFEPISFEKKENHIVCTLKFIDGRIINPLNARAFSRGFSAVIEATIIATRLKMININQISKKIEELGEIVKKCGGKRDKEAFSYILSVLRKNSINLDFQS